MAKKRTYIKEFKIRQQDILKANRRGSREGELENSTGWVAKHKVHKNKKSYTRKYQINYE